MAQSRHAYLILAHGNQGQLKTLISFIDDERNDIYIHLDKKWREVNPEDIAAESRRSNVYFVDRVSVYWGGFSVIHAEMNLFCEACLHGNYSYYHLLSGLDLPVKSQDYIHSFFDNYNGYNFIQPVEYEGTEKFRIRYEQFHFLQDGLIGRKRNIWKYIDFASCYAQRALGIKRFRNRELHGAWQWVSVTSDLVSHLVKRRTEILKRWRYTYCCDELFLYSEIVGTSLVETLSPLGSLRFIEWEWQAKRDLAPRVLTIEDFSTLASPNILFARKFVAPTSNHLIEALRVSNGMVREKAACNSMNTAI